MTRTLPLGRVSPPSAGRLRAPHRAAPLVHHVVSKAIARVRVRVDVDHTRPAARQVPCEAGGPMRLTPCSCDPRLLQRIRRPLWARVLFPSRGLYYCWSCDGVALIKVPADPEGTSLSPLTSDPRTHVPASTRP
jgi:hypothetical protein